MAGIVIPHDRTSKQPCAGCCMNPACKENSDDERFVFMADHDHFACPKCGADRAPTVGLLSLVHFLIPDRKGHIVGMGGLRYQLGCDDTRAYLATVTNEEAATGELSIVNCPGCLAEASKRNLTRFGQAIVPTSSAT